MSEKGGILGTDVNAIRISEADNESKYRLAVTVGTSAVQIMSENPKRTEYRIRPSMTNTHSIYLGYDSKVSATAYVERVDPGFTFEDSGEVYTVYKGPVWLLGGAAGQSVDVFEVQKT